MPSKPAKTILAFDVYGTLIDPLHMEDHLHAAFGENARNAAELWRAKQLEYSFRRALMKKYVTFDVCTSQALRFVLAHFGVSLSAESQAALLERYRRLPAYPDVSAALENLASRSLEIVACSNGTERAVRGALDHAGILPRFRKIVSVDAVRTFKPDPAVYHRLVAELHAAGKSIWLISSNPFDVIGAKACGLRSAWVQRDPKRVFDPWEFEPDVVVHDLNEFASKFDNRRRAK